MSVSNYKKIPTAKIIEAQKFLNVFREIDPTMAVGEIIFFLEAAKLNEPNLRQVADYSGIAHSSASRYLTHLTTGRPHRGEVGKEFLSTFENPADRKQKIIELTVKGQEFLQKLFSK